MSDPDEEYEWWDTPERMQQDLPADGEDPDAGAGTSASPVGVAQRAGEQSDADSDKSESPVGAARRAAQGAKKRARVRTPSSDGSESDETDRVLEEFMARTPVDPAGTAARATSVAQPPRHVRNLSSQPPLHAPRVAGAERVANGLPPRAGGCGPRPHSAPSAGAAAASAAASPSSSSSSSPAPPSHHATPVDGADLNVGASAWASATAMPHAGAADDARSQVSSAASRGAGEMVDFDATTHGAGIDPVPMQLSPHVDSASPWVALEDTDEFVPVRAMRINVPADLLRDDARRWSDWRSPPAGEERRQAAYDAVCSLMFAGTAKGIESGTHSELDACSGEDSASEAGNAASDKPKSVHIRSYTFTGTNGARTPMYVVAIEELTVSTEDPPPGYQGGEVMGYGIWKFVQDATHSDSKLVSAVIDESRATADSIRATRVPATKRKTSLMREARSVSALVSGNSAAAGLGYTRVHTLNDFLTELSIISKGRTGEHGTFSRGFFPSDPLPHDTLTTPMKPDVRLGGTHALSPEYLFNARRPMALAAGLLDKDGAMLPVDERLLDPTTYFRPDGTFCASPDVVSMHFLANPFACNLYDCTLPVRKLDGLFAPGPTLLGVFLESDAATAGGVRAAAAAAAEAPAAAAELTVHERKAKERRDNARFREHVTGHIQLPSTGGASFDCLDPAVGKAATAAEDGGHKRAQASRHRATHAHGRARARACPCVPRASLSQPTLPAPLPALPPFAHQECPLMRLRAYTNRIRTTVIDSWRRSALSQNKRFTTGSDARKRADAAVQTRYEQAVRELVELHLSGMSALFIAQDERAKLPPGFVAQWDGLLAAVAQNGGSASVAFGGPGEVGRQRMARDRSTFAETWDFIGTVWRDDGFIDGRDRSIMDELFFTAHETQAPKTFITVISGRHGNGKSVRSERAMALFPEGVFMNVGSASAKSGTNGKNGHRMNGRATVHDEMNRDLIATDSTKLEYYKSIVQTRMWTHERTEKVPVQGGGEQFETVVNETDHRETITILTNFGLTFIDAKSKDLPCDSRMALISRTVFQLARPSTTGKARGDAEFKNHLGRPETQARVVCFRLLVSLTLAVRMALEGVPFLTPDTDHAKACFELMDAILDRFGLPQPTPRKKERREQVLITLATIDAVARVFFYKQTSIDFEAGKPWYDEARKPHPQKWHVRQLADVLSTLVITPEIILMSWSFGLDYTVGTSACGFAAMSVLAGHFGLAPDTMLRSTHSGPLSEVRARGPTATEQSNATTSRQLSPDRSPPSPSVLQARMARAKQEHDAANARLSAFIAAGSRDRAARQQIDADIQRSRDALSRHQLAATQMRLASQPPANLLHDPPFLLDAAATATPRGLQEAAERLRKLREKRATFRAKCDAHVDMLDPNTFAASLNVSTADFLPSALEALSLYTSPSLASWATNRMSETGVGVWGARHGGIRFREISKPDPANGVAAVYDFGTLADPLVGTTFRDAAASIARGSSIMRYFDLTDVILRDFLIMFSLGGEGDRVCTEAPRLAKERSAGMAYITGHDGQTLEAGPGTNRLVAVRPPLESVGSDADFSSAVRTLTGSGRLPLLGGVFSNKSKMCAPVSCGSDGIQLNLGAALAHISFIAEAVLVTSAVAGYSRPEKPNGAPAGLRRSDNAEEGLGDAEVAQLPYALDTPLLYLTVEAGKLFTNDLDSSRVADSYTKLGLEYDAADANHFTHRFEGIDDTRLLSMRVSTERAADVPAAPAKQRRYSASYVQAAHGRAVSAAEVRAYNDAHSDARANIANPMSMSGYLKHAIESLHERGLLPKGSNSEKSIRDVNGDRVRFLTDVATTMPDDLPENLAFLKSFNLAPMQFTTHENAPACDLEEDEEELEDAVPMQASVIDTDDEYEFQGFKRQRAA